MLLFSYLRNKYFLFFAILFLFSAFQFRNKGKVLKIGISPDYPPFSYSERGEYKGIEIEMIKRICKKKSIPYEFISMSFSSLIQSLQSDKLDLAIAAITPSVDRKQKVCFSDPYHVTKFVFLKNPNSENSFIATQLGSEMAFSLEKNGIEAILFNDLNFLLQSFLNGQFSKIYVEEKYAEKILREYPNFILEKTDEGVEYAIAFPLESSYMKIFSQEIRDMIANDEINDILREEERPSERKFSRYQNMFFILKGVYANLLCGICAILFSIPTSLVLAAYSYTYKSFIVKCFIYQIRSTPTLLQLYFFFYLLDFTAFVVTTITIGINSTAYLCEIFQGEIQKVAKNSFEHARASVKVRDFVTWRKVILPQVLKKSLSAIKNEIAAVIKETSLGGFIGMDNVMSRALAVAATSFDYNFSLLTVAVAYFLCAASVEFITKRFLK